MIELRKNIWLGVADGFLLPEGNSDLISKGQIKLPPSGSESMACNESSSCERGRPCVVSKGDEYWGTSVKSENPEKPRRESDLS